MAYYSVCKLCGAHLDPNEKCDCSIKKNEKRKTWTFLKEAKEPSGYKQLTFAFGAGSVAGLENAGK